ncbi:MAG: HrcA family transcriptional regulator, partial [Arachnia sp.]
TTERLMVIVVNSAGRVEQQILELPSHDEGILGTVRTRIREAAIGKAPGDAAGALGMMLDGFSPLERAVAVPVITVVLELLASEPTSQVVVAGMPNLATFGTAFQTGMRPLLEALEEQVVLMRLLGEVSGEGDITVRIGQENTAQGFQSTSLIASAYGPSGDLAANLGVVGPTRMDYPSTIASVRAVARYVSRFLLEG